MHAGPDDLPLRFSTQPERGRFASHRPCFERCPRRSSIAFEKYESRNAQERQADSSSGKPSQLRSPRAPLAYDDVNTDTAALCGGRRPPSKFQHLDGALRRRVLAIFEPFLRASRRSCSVRSCMQIAALPDDAPTSVENVPAASQSVSKSSPEHQTAPSTRRMYLPRDGLASNHRLTDAQVELRNQVPTHGHSLA
ncbi:hypothetical protein BV20DRAFT_110692 [Pilatotrama ljubarskyi]|nr:hypothetical protein BV20DRAFT_110692 [Pilatotrama ljubarskyi]